MLKYPLNPKEYRNALLYMSLLYSLENTHIICPISLILENENVNLKKQLLLKQKEVTDSQQSINTNLINIYKKSIENQIGLRIEESKAEYIVNIIKPYTPTISDVFKIKDKPSIEDANTLYTKISSEIARKLDGGNPWEIEKVFDSINGLSKPNTSFKNYRFLAENQLIEKVNNQLIIKANLYETHTSNISKILPSLLLTIINFPSLLVRYILFKATKRPVGFICFLFLSL